MGHILQLRRRLLLFVVAGFVAAAVAAGVALARTSAPKIGTGVVVINTALGYQQASAAGTGMVLTSSGEILTNNHVIRGATTVRIVVPGTTHRYTAKVVGYDVADDVAVLKAVGASNLKTVSTAASAAVRVGSRVTAVGNANGAGRLISARGTVTGVNKSITVSDDSGGSESLTGLIETNANLQPGDSGGPLLNSSGKVIGMDTAAASGFVLRSSASDGYAIKIGKALSIAKQIVAGHSSARVHIGATAFLGVQIQSGTSGSGVVVAGVVAGGPAAAAGISAGDVIVSIDGNAINSSNDVASVVLTKKPGATVAVTIADQFGSEQTVNVTLTSGPPQ
jgi:S1-C subfamily serine protease